MNILQDGSIFPPTDNRQRRLTVLILHTLLFYRICSSVTEEDVVLKAFFLEQRQQQDIDVWVELKAVIRLHLLHQHLGPLVAAQLLTDAD